MKIEIIPAFMCMLVLCMVVTKNTLAQQPTYVRPATQAPMQMQNGSFRDNYSFSIYTAPGSAFGYDIFRNGKPLFHQFALILISNDGTRSLATKSQAEKAAGVAIEKIKKGMPALITNEEMKKIISQ